MLKRVLSTIQARGWVEPGRSRERAVFLTAGNCLWMLLFDGGKRHTHVKFSTCICLCREAQLHASAFRAYPDWVPRPIGNLHEPGLDLVVSQAVDFVPPGRDGLLAVGGSIGSQVLQYFGSAPRASLPECAQSPGRGSLLAAMVDYFRDRNPRATSYLAELLGDSSRLAACPSLLQHGDFVFNNLGDSAGRLCIFDWEEFGVVDLTGFDLYTLLFSLDRVRTVRASPASPDQAAFVAKACQAMGLDLPTFEALLPLYALVFRYLKRNFGPSVQQRADEAFDQVLLQRVTP